MTIHIARTHNKDGTSRTITLWSGPGRPDRWQCRVSTLASKLDSLCQWLAIRGLEDQWIAEHLPEVGAILGAKLLRTIPGHKWVYGRIGVVRAHCGRYSAALDIHGGTKGLAGSWDDLDQIIRYLQQCGAQQIICVAPGENSGDTSRAWRAENPFGIFHSDQFSALLRARPLSSSPLEAATLPGPHNPEPGGEDYPFPKERTEGHCPPITHDTGIVMGATHGATPAHPCVASRTPK